MGEIAQSIGGLLGRIEDFISAEQMAARRNKVSSRLEDNRSQGRDYGQLYQDSYLARNQDSMPASVSAMQTGQYFLPLVGEGLDFGEGITELLSENPNYATAGGLLAAAGLGLIPGAGDALAQGVGAAARGAKRTAGGLLDVGRRSGDEITNFLRATDGSVAPGFPKDSSGIFGPGAQTTRYVDEATDGTMDVVVRQDGPSSIIDLLVPEANRGQGGGSRLLAEAMEANPNLQGQVSSKAAATNAYRAGRRPYGQPNATLDDVFKAIDENSSVNMVSPQSGLLGDAADLNPAQMRSQEVIDLLNSGRASEVTDEMLAAADNTYLYNNYDLPMDEASRMARADAGWPHPGFHGTASEVEAFNASKSGNLGGGVYQAPDAETASSRAMMDRFRKGKDAPANVIATRSRMENPLTVTENPFMDINTEKLRELGYDGVVRTKGDGGPVAEFNVFDPANVRSVNARFDPRLKHLKNLSAGMAAMGLLDLLTPEQREGLL